MIGNILPVENFGASDLARKIFGHAEVINSPAPITNARARGKS